MATQATSRTTFGSMLVAAGLAASLALSTGCRSSSAGSKFAWWNPWSKSAADTSAIAKSAPGLPSDSATPLVEGLAKPAATAVAATTAAPTPSAAAPGGEAPAFRPSTPAPVPSVAQTTPAKEAAKIASVPTLPTSPATPAMAKPAGAMPGATPAMMAATPAAAGPYDPNGYRPEVAAQAVAQVEDRYAAAASTAASYNDFESFMAKGASQATGEANRYASTVTPAATSVAAAPTQASTQLAAAAKGLQQIASAAPATSYPVAAYPATTPSRTPAVATALAGAKPAASPVTSPVIGSLPATNLAPVQLASKPGQYRPGSTGTYRPGVSVAALPPAASAPAATPLPRDASGLPVYPTTAPAPAPTQLR